VIILTIFSKERIMKKTISLVLILALCIAAKVTNADFTFGTPTNLGPTVNSSYGEAQLSISADGLMLYFASDRPGGCGDSDIWVTRRPTIVDDWGTPENLGPPVNTSQTEYCPCISADGLELYFALYKPAGNYIFDIWMAKRPTINDAWGMPIKLEPPINTSGVEDATHLSTDGLELYFTAYNRAGGYGADDIWVTRRATKNDPWEPPINLGTVVNSSASEDHPFLSADGLALFFSEDRGQPLHPLRPGGFGNVDMWVTTRSSISEPWGTPVNLGPIVNSTSLDGGPVISPDGFTLYFSSERPGGFGGAWGDIYQAPIISIVDLNNDGIVDAEDMCIMVDHWGTDNRMCDIGPMPWGDGIVNVHDLIVLAEHLFEEFPPVE
jgi:Tol biopolymer transport system component